MLYQDTDESESDDDTVDLAKIPEPEIQLQIDNVSDNSQDSDTNQDA